MAVDFMVMVLQSMKLKQAFAKVVSNSVVFLKKTGNFVGIRVGMNRPDLQETLCMGFSFSS